MSYDLSVLEQHRDALLLAEVGAWLHMPGKFHEDFLSGQHELDVQIPPDLTVNYSALDQLLRNPWPGPIWAQMPISELNAGNLSLFNLIKEHRNCKAPTRLQRLLWDAHGRGSGIEKGVLVRFAPGQVTTVYPATAVGLETRPIDLSALQNRRQALYGFLQIQLDILRDANAHVNWAEFRETFIRRLEQDFRTSVAETRRPLDDVTMFDQTVASVALFKAALAQNLLAGWKEPVQNKVTDKYHWRLLRVGLNSPTYWGQTARINDLLSRKAQIKPALNAVQTLLEETCLLGAEVYRDENGSLFVLPDIADLLDATVNKFTLRERLQQIAESAFDGETRFKLDLSDHTRNMLLFGQLATASLPPPTPRPEQVKDWWDGIQGRDVCPVCGLRPQGPGRKALERKVCQVCETRRSGRAKIWASDLITTIWTDEVADVNGRLALVVGQFGLEPWLAGEAFNSVMMFDPASRQLKDEKRNGKRYPFNYTQLLTEIQEALRRGQFKGKTLLDNLVLKNVRGGTFEDFYDLQVSDTDLGEGRSTRDPAILALAMMRQNPTFARIRRVWEMTKHFWEKVQRDFGNVILPAGPRLKVRGTLQARDRKDKTPGPYHTYDLVLPRGVKLSVVWDGQRFITCDNLNYFAGEGQLNCPVQEVLQKETTLTIEEPVGYGSANKVWGEITLDQDAQPIPNSTYTPAISILAEPRTFMTLVPADKALDVACAIKTKYEREMGKVRNRLPLHLGVVYFGRRTPLAAAMDAGRRMLDVQMPEQPWTVEKVDPPLPRSAWPTEVKLALKQDARIITIVVPTVMGDAATPDVWYPYWRVEGSPTGRERQFTGPNRKQWVHVCDLRAGDQVGFTPSTFDFEYLDTTARRFEVSYSDGQRRGEGKRQRPYLLEELEQIEQVWAEVSKVSNSQIRMIASLIETKRRDWLTMDTPEAQATAQATFCQFVRDVLHEAKIYSELLERAALSGMLADALELHLTIAKAGDDKQSKEAN